MFRLGIIIKGYSKSETELSSDRQYVEYYTTFLTSTAGGAWDLNEDLLILEDPTIKDLEEIIENLEPYYVLLIMIGHGATQDSKQLFQINETTVIQAGQLALDVDKQVVILESCRSQINGKVKTVDLKDRIPKFKNGGVVRRPLTRVESRNFYNSIIEECENGLVICYPCSDNEVAKGYYYSFALLRRSFEWHLHSYNKCFPITQLTQYVAGDVNVISRGSQNPTTDGNIGFPFVVSKY